MLAGWKLLCSYRLCHSHRSQQIIPWCIDTYLLACKLIEASCEIMSLSLLTVSRINNQVNSLQALLDAMGIACTHWLPQGLSLKIQIYMHAQRRRQGLVRRRH